MFSEIVKLSQDYPYYAAKRQLLQKSPSKQIKTLVKDGKITHVGYLLLMKQQHWAEL